MDSEVHDGQRYWYRIVARDPRGVATIFGPVSSSATILAKALALSAIAPNPSPGPLRIRFSVPREMRVATALLDLQGREVVRLVDETMRAGAYERVWTADARLEGLRPGVYLVRMVAGGEVLTRRFVLAR